MELTSIKLQLTCLVLNDLKPRLLISPASTEQVHPKCQSCWVYQLSKHGASLINTSLDCPESRGLSIALYEQVNPGATLPTGLEEISILTESSATRFPITLSRGVGRTL